MNDVSYPKLFVIGRFLNYMYLGLWLGLVVVLGLSVSVIDTSESYG